MFDREKYGPWAVVCGASEGIGEAFARQLCAAGVNVVFGLLLAWVLVRYDFPGKKFADALVDLPFALPTAVAGISLTALLAPNGWIGELLAPWGLQLAFNPKGVVIALVFIGIPFVVRTVQPVLEDLEQELEEAASCLGASRWQTFQRVIFPAIAPALLTGFAMAFARAIGEYGSVIFIAGNMPMVSEITPLIIISKLVDGNYPNYRQVIPKEAGSKVRLEREKLLDSVTRAASRNTDSGCARSASNAQCMIKGLSSCGENPLASG